VGKPAQRRSPRSALAEALRLQVRLNRALERSLEGPADAPSPARPTRAPAIDLIETPHAFVLRADVPGLVPSSLDIAIAPRAVALAGRLAGGGRPRPFRRRVLLPAEIDPASGRGSLRRGVLSLRLAKLRRLSLVAKPARRGAA
jgi:HSP20 family molecular chaperone IbpA